MNINEIIESYRSRAYNLDIGTLERILRVDNKLSRYDVINRIIISEYNEKYGEIDDVRTAEEWYCIGRKVRNKERTIPIVNNIKNTVYIDKATGKKVTYNELSYEEINMALNLGLLEKDEKECYIEVLNGYSYDNTEEIMYNRYEKYQYIGFNEMKSILENIYAIKFTTMQGEESNIYISTSEPIRAIEIMAEETAKVAGIKDVVNFVYAFRSLCGAVGGDVNTNTTPEKINDIYEVIGKIVNKSSNKEQPLYCIQADRDRIERAKKMIKVLEANSIHIELT